MEARSTHNAAASTSASREEEVVIRLPEDEFERFQKIAADDSEPGIALRNAASDYRAAVKAGRLVSR